MDTSTWIWLLIAFCISALCVCLWMPYMIRFLHRIKFGQTEREEGLESHKVKNGTPTMGGIVFILVPVILALIFGVFVPDLLNTDSLIVLLAYLGFGLIGFLDDYIIVVKKDNEGLKPKVKFLLQSILAIVFFLLYRGNSTTDIWIPILDVYLDLGILYFVLIFFMFTAETNAVNLTDGLDGLCAGQMIIALVPFLVFALLESNVPIAFLIVLVEGALCAYLYFNKYPAQIFMGDTGSLALGGFLAAVAMVLKQEILLILVGLVFVAEVLSVIIQVTSYKTRKKRVFKMAPLHHHFEMCGWSETKVVHRFWLVGIIVALLAIWIGVR